MSVFPRLISLADLKQRLDQVVERAIQSAQPFVVMVSQSHAVVLMSASVYDRLVSSEGLVSRGSPAGPVAIASVGKAEPTMSQIERSAILNRLRELGGNRTRTAHSLRIGLRTLQRKLREYERAGESVPPDMGTK